MIKNSDKLKMVEPDLVAWLTAFEKDNNYLRAQFPIDLLNRFTISFSLQDGYIVSSDSSKNCLEEINKSILKLTKLSLKRNKVNLLNNSIEHLIDQVKLLNLIEY